MIIVKSLSKALKHYKAGYTVRLCMTVDRSIVKNKSIVDVRMLMDMSNFLSYNTDLFNTHFKDKLTFDQKQFILNMLVFKKNFREIFKIWYELD